MRQAEAKLERVPEGVGEEPPLGQPLMEGEPLGERVTASDAVGRGGEAVAAAAEGVAPEGEALAESVTEAVGEGTPGVFTVHTSSSTAR